MQDTQVVGARSFADSRNACVHARVSLLEEGSRIIRGSIGKRRCAILVHSMQRKMVGISLAVPECSCTGMLFNSEILNGSQGKLVALHWWKKWDNKMKRQLMDLNKGCYLYSCKGFPFFPVFRLVLQLILKLLLPFPSLSFSFLK